MVLSGVGLATAIATRPHLTLSVAIASGAAVLVLVLLALVLWIAFRNLPELDQLIAKFDDESAADDTGRDPRVE